ncbi:MAG: hypothetical protein VYA34_05510 [Myxococcota bacterium]|nr:hypothetical protein [Myxococcota bacterium]
MNHIILLLFTVTTQMDKRNSNRTKTAKVLERMSVECFLKLSQSQRQRFVFVFIESFSKNFFF